MWRRGFAAAAAFRLPNPLLRNFEARSIVLAEYLPGTHRRGNYGRYGDALRSARRSGCRCNSGEVVTGNCDSADSRLRLSALKPPTFPLIAGPLTLLPANRGIETRYLGRPCFAMTRIEFTRGFVDEA